MSKEDTCPKLDMYYLVKTQLLFCSLCAMGVKAEVIGKDVPFFRNLSLRKVVVLQCVHTFERNLFIQRNTFFLGNSQCNSCKI